VVVGEEEKEDSEPEVEEFKETEMEEVEDRIEEE